MNLFQVHFDMGMAIYGIGVNIMTLWYIRWGLLTPQPSGGGGPPNGNGGIPLFWPSESSAFSFTP